MWPINSTKYAVSNYNSRSTAEALGASISTLNNRACPAWASLARAQVFAALWWIAACLCIVLPALATSDACGLLPVVGPSCMAERGFFHWTAAEQVESYGQDKPRHASFSPVNSLLAMGFG